MKKVVPVIVLVIGIVLIAIASYFLSRAAITMQDIIALKNSYGDRYELYVNIAVAQILSMASIIACVLTIITYFLLKNRLQSSKKIGILLLKFEFPASIIALIIDVAIYLIFAFVSTGSWFLIAATIIILLFDLYPGLFFIVNIIIAFTNSKK
ncbi:MAG: hypothetical protein K2I29_03860 [Clostridia bacterium]|nr:hypothetical protein [Clostridia bacterium]